MKRLSPAQFAVLRRMAENRERIAYFPPTQSAWIYLDPLKGRIRLRVATFNSLTLLGAIKHTESVRGDYFYDITDKGRSLYEAEVSLD